MDQETQRLTKIAQGLAKAGQPGEYILQVLEPNIPLSKNDIIGRVNSLLHKESRDEETLDLATFSNATEVLIDIGLLELVEKTEANSILEIRNIGVNMLYLLTETGANIKNDRSLLPQNIHSETQPDFLTTGFLIALLLVVVLISLWLYITKF